MPTHASFPCLIDALIRKHHESELKMAHATGISTTTISRWRRWAPRARDLRLLDLLVTYAPHNLTKKAVLDLTGRDLRRQQDGERVPLPDVSDVTPGPRRKKKKKKKPQPDAT